MDKAKQTKVLERFLKNGTIPDNRIHAGFLGSAGSGKTQLMSFSVLNHELMYGEGRRVLPPKNRLRAAFGRAGRKIKSALKRVSRGIKKRL